MTQRLKVYPEPEGFGARVSGVQLSESLSEQEIDAIRSAWLAHQVLCFPDQPLTHDELAAFAARLGEFGDDPFLRATASNPHVVEVRRNADERTSPFGSNWHSDWSFQHEPPSATILHAKVVPPVGGDTLFANGYRAWDDLDAETRARVGNLTALHSARRPYSRTGLFARESGKRSMTILSDDRALAVQEHPLVRTHPETGRTALWINPVYTIGIKELPGDEGAALLADLFAHSTSERYILRVQWAPDMLTLWDNRCVQHCALGGYDGYQRLMHRTTVAGDRPYYAQSTAA